MSNSIALNAKEYGVWLSTAALLAAAFAVTPVRAEVSDDQIITYVEVEQLEHRWTDGDDAFAWDAQAWIGDDFNKAWFKTEGERPETGGLEKGELQALYSRNISTFWDVQAGLRYDLRPRPSRVHGVIGFQGLAPYFLEVDTAAFVSNKGDLTGRLEVEYDILLTQRLIAVPSVEVSLAAQNIEELGIGGGVTDIEFGLRLRYEFIREVAPYIGVNWEKKLGKTADFARDEGESTGSLAFVAGIRFWF